jgi:hypothetical protein
MDTYQPYFYIIQDKISRKYYAGSRYGKNAHPSELLQENGYTTSSTVINEMIEKNGLSSFQIVRLRLFTSGIEAHNYETRFLQKVNAANNQSFLNGHNNDGMIIAEWDEKLIDRMLSVRNQTISKLLEEDPQWHEKQIQQRKITMMKRYGVTSNGLLKSTQENRKATFLRKYGYEHNNQTPESRKRISENMSGRIWIKKGEKSKMVPKSELVMYLKNGWCKGRNYKRN